MKLIGPYELYSNLEFTWPSASRPNYENYQAAEAWIWKRSVKRNPSLPSETTIKVLILAGL